jgi:hypothetical protein
MSGDGPAGTTGAIGAACVVAGEAAEAVASAAATPTAAATATPVPEASVESQRRRLMARP